MHLESMIINVCVGNIRETPGPSPASFFLTSSKPNL